MAQTKEDIAKLKAEYVAFYADCPVQKYAAAYIGRDEGTIARWAKTDGEFADAVKRAKAVWVRKLMLRTKAEFALERLENEVFGKRPPTFPLVQMPAPLVYLPEDVSEDFFDKQGL